MYTGDREEESCDGGSAGMMAFWYDMIQAVQSATPALVIVACLAGVVAVLAFAILNIQKINGALAIGVSTLIGCALMVPTVSAFNHLVDSRVEGAIIGEAKAEIKAQRAEAARLAAENKVKLLEKEKLDSQITLAKQSIELEALEDTITLLENAQVSVQSFQKIVELALLQTNLKQTAVYKRPINQPKAGLGVMADYYNDEVLVVTVHDVNAKFGVDLKAVKIAKLDENTVLVSGIRPIFIGADKNISSTPVKEIRRTNYKKGVVASIDVQNDPQSLHLADAYAETYKTEFQTKLGTELNFMDDAVIQLAQNFITVMLAPVYQNLRFSAESRSDSLPLMEYLQRELEANAERKAELLTLQKTAAAALSRLDEEGTSSDPQEPQ